MKKTSLSPLLLLLPLLALAADEKGEPSTSRPEALPVRSDWEARADKWFESAEAEARKKQMRAQTKALRQPCRYCHTKDWTGYTDRLDISRQMMAISAEHGVACIDCHPEKKGQLSELGQTAKEMWKVSREKGVFCEHCHEKGTKFEKLTGDGKAFHDEWEARAKKLKQTSEPAPAPP